MNIISIVESCCCKSRAGGRPVIAFFYALLFSAFATYGHAKSPSVGDVAPDFSLKTLSGESVKLSGFTSADNIVLVVLRGWPGYQCPFCTTQVYEYISHAADFSARKAQIILIYSGPSEALQAHAQDFLRDKPLPDEFVFLVDPNYDFANRYSLRWAAKGETVYPSTFVLDENRIVRFEHVSQEHGDRVSAAAVLRYLQSGTTGTVQVQR